MVARPQIDVGHEAAQADHGRLPAEGLQVGPHEAVRDRGQLRHIHVLGQRHAAAVDLQDLLAPVAVGDRDGDLPVEAARPAQRRIQGIGDVGGGNDDDVLALERPSIEARS